MLEDMPLSGAERAGRDQRTWMRVVRALVGCFLAVTGCAWSALVVAQTVPVPAAKPAASDAADAWATVDHDAIAALRELAVGAELNVALEDLEGASHAAPLLGPSLPERPGAQAGVDVSARPETVSGLRRGGAGLASDELLGKLVGPTFGNHDRSGADWGLSVGVRKNTGLRPAIPGAGPEDELGVGAGVRVDLSDGVTLGGGYGYFSDGWSGHLRDDRSSARPSDSDDLGADRDHHVAGLRLTFEFEPAPTLR
jgi:hypothetical protein